MITEGGLVRFNEKFMIEHGNIYGATYDALKHIENGNKPMKVSYINNMERKVDIKFDEYCRGRVNYKVPIKALKSGSKKMRRLE